MALLGCSCTKCKQFAQAFGRSKPVSDFDSGIPVIVCSRSLGESDAAVDGYQQRAVNFFKVLRLNFVLVDLDEADDLRWLLAWCAGRGDGEMLDRLRAHQVPLLLLDDELVACGQSVFAYVDWLEQLRYDGCLDAYVDAKLHGRPPQLRLPLQGVFHEFYPTLQVHRVSPDSHLSPAAFAARGRRWAARYARQAFTAAWQPPPRLELDDRLPVGTAFLCASRQCGVWPLVDWPRHERAVRALHYPPPFASVAGVDGTAFHYRLAAPSTLPLGPARCWLQLRGVVPAEHSDARHVVVELHLSQPLGQLFVHATVAAVDVACLVDQHATVVTLATFDLDQFAGELFSQGSTAACLAWQLNVLAASDSPLADWLHARLDNDRQHAASLGLRCLRLLASRHHNNDDEDEVPLYLYEHYETELRAAPLVDELVVHCHAQHLVTVREQLGGAWIDKLIADFSLRTL